MSPALIFATRWPLAGTADGRPNCLGEKYQRPDNTSVVHFSAPRVCLRSGGLRGFQPVSCFAGRENNSKDGMAVDAVSIELLSAANPNNREKYKEFLGFWARTPADRPLSA
jgi:hypothetical protein